MHVLDISQVSVVQRFNFYIIIHQHLESSRYRSSEFIFGVLASSISTGIITEVCTLYPPLGWASLLSELRAFP